MNRLRSRLTDVRLSVLAGFSSPLGEGMRDRERASESVNGKNRTRILLADDDLDMLAATAKVLQADFDVVDMVSDGLSLVDAAFKLRPDVIVTDISMPKMNGLEAVRMIRSSLPGIKFVFLTMYGGMDIERKRKDLEHRAMCSSPRFARN